MRKQLNTRVPQRTIDQILEMVDSEKFESQSHVVIVAVEKMYESELSMFIGSLKDEQITIYALCEPGTENIRYIGQTYNLRARVKQHISNANKGIETRLYEWLSLILNSGKMPTVKVIDTVDLELSNKREKEAIQEALNNEYNLLNYSSRAVGGLFNSSNGGKMPATNAENQKTLKQRRQAAYRLLKQLAMESGIMEHWKDSDGYDEFIKLLESGEFVLKFEAVNDTH